MRVPRQPARRADAPRRRRASASSWQGTIKMMTPTLVVPRADGGRHLVTPPPASVVPGEVVEAMADKLVEMADQLGLRCG